MPLHPALAHLPLGLSLVLPLIAAFAAWRLWKGERPATFLVLLLSAILVGGVFATRETGEEDADLVKKVVPKGTIGPHADAADFFTGGAVLVLVLAIATVALGARKQARYAAAALVVVTLWHAAVGVRTGHLGGEIVYENNGASAHAKGTGAAAPAAPAPAD